MAIQQQPTSLTEEQLKQRTEAWELQGFQFLGNGFLPNDDGPECPLCGEQGFWFALWENPEVRISETYEGETFEHNATVGLNHCYDCDYVWVDEEELPNGNR